MNFCLSDLVPPLRWSDAAAITLLHGQPHLPEAWWRSLPMPRVLAGIGPESLGELLTEIALEHWPAAAIGDVLPALHVLDPDEADEPHVAIAIDRAGSWPGLLALSSRELMDQPFVKARPVLNSLFAAVFVRLAPGEAVASRSEPAEKPAGSRIAPQPAISDPAVSDSVPAPAVSDPSPSAPSASDSGASVPGASVPGASVPGASVPGTSLPGASDEPAVAGSRAEAPSVPGALSPEARAVPEAPPLPSRKPRSTKQSYGTPFDAFGTGTATTGQDAASPAPAAESRSEPPAGRWDAFQASTSAQPVEGGQEAAVWPETSEEVPGSERAVGAESSEASPEDQAALRSELPGSSLAAEAAFGAESAGASPEGEDVLRSAGSSPAAEAAFTAESAEASPEDDDVLLSGSAAAEGEAALGSESAGASGEEEAALGSEAAGLSPEVAAGLSPEVEGGLQAASSGAFEAGESLPEEAPRGDQPWPADVQEPEAGAVDEGEAQAVENEVARDEAAGDRVAGDEAVRAGAQDVLDEGADEDREAARHEDVRAEDDVIGDADAARSGLDAADPVRQAGEQALAAADSVPGGETPEARGVPGGEVDLHALIESSFAGLDDKTWAVAQNRVFTDTPSAVEQLAKLFAVAKEEIVSVEAELRQRLLRWLAVEETAPYRAHLDDLRARLGVDPPRDLLIGAADWHGREIRALDVPAWQFVQATLAAPAHVPDMPGAGDVPEPSLRGPAAEPSVPPASAAPPGSAASAAPSAPPAPQAFAQEPRFQPPGHEPQGAPVQAPARFEEFAAPAPAPSDGNGKPYQGFKDVALTKRCFRQPDGRWWLRIDVTAEQLATGECALPSGFAAYLGLTPGASWTVRSAAGELSMSWHGRPSISQMGRLLADVGAREGGHLFITLSKEGVLRAKHLPVATPGASKISKALRLADYTGLSSAIEHAARIIAIRIGMSGNVSLDDLKTRLRERGDRDLLDLLD
ncbi:hypothetical protein [Nonomuraea sp. bgisy101]|uniref:hypothetical protein n=1 Tax=Nonomuraea sp. bgisy101 TaxID=3413784 RepID=UPI003D765ED1